MPVAKQGLNRSHARGRRHAPRSSGSRPSSSVRGHAGPGSHCLSPRSRPRPPHGSSMAASSGWSRPPRQAMRGWVAGGVRGASGLESLAVAGDGGVDSAPGQPSRGVVVGRATDLTCETPSREGPGSRARAAGMPNVREAPWCWPRRPAGTDRPVRRPTASASGRARLAWFPGAGTGSVDRGEGPSLPVLWVAGAEVAALLIVRWSRRAPYGGPLAPVGAPFGALGHIGTAALQRRHERRMRLDDAKRTAY